MYIRNSMLDYLQVCISIGQWFGVSFISNINCQLSYRYFLIFINSFMDHLQPTFNVSLFPGVYIGYFIFLRSTYSQYCLVSFLQTLSVIYIRFNGEFYPALIFSLFSCVYICYFLVWWIIYIVHSMLSHLQMRSVTFFTSKSLRLMLQFVEHKIIICLSCLLIGSHAQMGAKYTFLPQNGQRLVSKYILYNAACEMTLC